MVDAGNQPNPTDHDEDWQEEKTHQERPQEECFNSQERQEEERPDQEERQEEDRQEEERTDEEHHPDAERHDQRQGDTTFLGLDPLGKQNLKPTATRTPIPIAGGAPSFANFQNMEQEQNEAYNKFLVWLNMQRRGGTTTQGEIGPASPATQNAAQGGERPFGLNLEQTAGGTSRQGEPLNTQTAEDTPRKRVKQTAGWIWPQGSRRNLEDEAQRREKQMKYSNDAPPWNCRAPPIPPPRPPNAQKKRKYKF